MSVICLYQDIAEAYEISAMPTFKMFKDSKQVEVSVKYLLIARQR